MQKLGFSALPAILWRKQTNAPNKFMGSGMMPPGAYITLEHEYVLVLRKGNKKEFKTEGNKQLRRESAFFWEERNVWFSDVWMDLKGTSQNLFDDKVRNPVSKRINRVENNSAKCIESLEDAGD